jgi:hypothetical protein
MTVSDLFWRLDPTWKVRYVTPIRDERKWAWGRVLVRSNRERAWATVNPRLELGEYPQKSEFCNRATR